MAARQGGGDPDSNPTLRTMFQKARDNSVPLDTIRKAVARGTGEEEGVAYEAVTYEGYAPGGVAVYVETLTDNRNRTGPEIRSLFNKAGGSMAEPGAVAWQFSRKGLLTVPAEVPEDDLMLLAIDAGAEDIVQQGDVWQVTCEPQDTMAVRDALVEGGVEVRSADLTMIPSTVIQIEDADVAASIMKVIEALDDHDDVQEVYANFDISDEILEQLSS